jgi:hypothetical protein
MGLKSKDIKKIRSGLKMIENETKKIHKLMESADSKTYEVADFIGAGILSKMEAKKQKRH